ncbi:hypothetical protein OV450_3767 [Actinobacteria bacterium OV450]|nr:hypothetical protein OV450_3767 [Actinobacteria bacterium OV450]
MDGWHPYESAPKTDGIASAIALDSLNVGALRQHRARQRKEWGKAWQDTGKVFTQENGAWLHPETAPETCRQILEGDAPALHDHADLGHVHEPAPRGRPGSRRSGGPAGTSCPPVRHLTRG